MENVLSHFDAGAVKFDSTIPKLIPKYDEMINALVAVIPFESDDIIRVADIGCGTGAVADRLKALFPRARITCIDNAAQMIVMAKKKLASYSDDIEFVVADVSQMEGNEEYDVILSSLALHHLASDEEKKRVFQAIYDQLSENGVFYTADLVLAPNPRLQSLYIDAWKQFMRQSLSDEEIETRWMKNHYEQDHPARLDDQLRWLAEIGFRDIDLIWKNYNFAVYGGLK